MSTAAEIELRPGESLIRSDIAEFWGYGQGHWWPETQRQHQHRASPFPHIAQMVLTDQRLAFGIPPKVPSARTLLRRLLAPFVALPNALRRRFPPVDQLEYFEWTEVDSIHGWTPELSGPPMLHIGNDGWFFRLRSDPTHIASSDAQRDHFGDVRAAWDAARSRAASHDDHP